MTDFLKKKKKKKKPFKSKYGSILAYKSSPIIKISLAYLLNQK